MTSARHTAGVLLIAIPLVFTAGFTGLQMAFDYPDILRRPAAEVLTRFAGSGWDLHLYWYAMMIAAVGMIPVSVTVGLTFWKRDPTLSGLAIAFGALAGLVQTLGLVRWVVLTPALAAAYVDPSASELDRAMTASVFNAANAYIGAGVGEHLGYLFTGLWTLLVSALIAGDRRIMAIAGAVLSLGVMAGMLEPLGITAAADINAIAFSLWAIWALALGVLILLGRRRAALAPLQAG